MTALIVTGAIALLIFILLASSIRVDVEYDSVFKYRVKYLFFTFIKNPLSPGQIRKKQKKELKAKKKKEKEQKKQGAHLMQRSEKKQVKSKVSEVKSEETNEQEKSETRTKDRSAGGNAPAKPKIKFSTDLISRVWGKASPHVKRLFKKIRLSNVVVDITTGGDDAAKTAISYGVHCGAVYGLVTFLNNAISFNADRISVKADFSLPKNEYYLKGTVKLRLSTLLHSGIWGFFAVFAELRKASGAPPEKGAVPAKKAA